MRLKKASKLFADLVLYINSDLILYLTRTDSHSESF